ncbi:MAG: sensor protein KdpD [Candidatus Aquicultorales bacterium]
MEGEKLPETPEEISEGPQETSRARFKLYIGAAAGVGKTYAMLEEAQRLKERGVDVLVGFVETHGRAETEVKLRGLESTSRKTIEYRGVTFEEMDTDAIIEHRPLVALVDELAHTNTPGLKHAKRYQDVQEILDAGINVISTINIQHLESLNDVIADLTGVRVRETIPDKVLERADEVVLVDISPEALRQRIQEGKVYAPQKVQQALNNFFRTENLAALREIVLRQVADEIDVKLEDVQRQREGAPGVAERVMACITPYPESQRVLRRAWRMAKRFHGDLYVLYVEESAGRKLSDEEKRSLESLKRLTATLGGHWLVASGDDTPRLIVEQANQQNVSNVVVGEPKERLVFGAFRQPFIVRLLDQLSGIDLHIVTGEKKSERGD